MAQGESPPMDTEIPQLSKHREARGGGVSRAIAT